MPPSLFTLEYHLAELRRMEADRSAPSPTNQVGTAGSGGARSSIPSLHHLLARVQALGSNGRVAAH
jgi:hypothetical protein